MSGEVQRRAKQAFHQTDTVSIGLNGIIFVIGVFTYQGCQPCHYCSHNLSISLKNEIEVRTY